MKNRMANGKGLGGILAIGLLALLLVTACAPAPLEEEAKPVEFGFIAPFTGAGAREVQLGFYGMEDYFKYFNKETGIPGVTVKAAWADNQRQLAVSMSAFQKFIERGIFAFSLVDAETTIPIMETLKNEDLVWCSTLQNEEVYYPPSWVYGSAPTYTEVFASLADYIVKNWEEERPPRLAFVIFEGRFGRSPVEGGTKYAESLGIEMLPTEIAPFVVLDATTELLRLSEHGADFVYIQGLPSMSVPIVRDAERLGLLDKMHFCGVSVSDGELLLEGGGAAAEGYLVPKIRPSWDETEVPGIKLMIDNQIEYYGQERSRKDPAYAWNWVQGAVVCEAIKRGIEEVGYENLDGSAIRRALDSIKDFDVYGLSKISYTPEDHRGSDAVAIYELRGGKIVRVSDWREAPMLVPEE
jgi:branched-chain amino acid transport system substrate-binding protein